MSGSLVRGRPVPTDLAVWLLGAGLLPAVLAVLSPAFAWVAAALDLAVVALCAADFLSAPRAGELSVAREVDGILSSGVPNPVRLRLSRAARGRRRLRGELRDDPPQGSAWAGHRQRFDLGPDEGERVALYRITPDARGDHAFGDLHVRLLGPLGLCARQERLPAARTVKVYPDLHALSREALALARLGDASGAHRPRRRLEGREFESFRDYRPGDDARTIDWKASARRARTMVRIFQPERNQPVLLFIDAGRHMAGRVAGRRKLDHAVDAALRLARISLDQGDLVGVVAFAREVQAHLPPAKGASHLRAITEALYRVEAALEESDYGRALDVAFARHHRRTLAVVLTDLADPQSASSLAARTLALRPHHLPLVASLLDEEVARLAAEVPEGPDGAYLYEAAGRLEDEYELTAAQLRAGGALVVRAPPSTFGPAAVNAYLSVKASGQL